MPNGYYSGNFRQWLGVPAVGFAVREAWGASVNTRKRGDSGGRVQAGVLGRRNVTAGVLWPDQPDGILAEAGQGDGIKGGDSATLD